MKDFEEREFDWYAVDDLGSVGHFSTAGLGLIPKIITINRHDEVSEQIIKLPELSQCELFEHEGDISDWIQIAKRGIYSYDWNRASNSYKIVAKPKRPISADDLAEVIRKPITELFLCGFCFELIEEFKMEEYTECR